MTISVLTAFVGGLLTILAPCAALLLPAFFAYAFTSRRTLLARTGVFFLGLLTALVPLGIAAGGLGGLVATHRSVITTGAGVIIIGLGIAQILALPLPRIALPWTQRTREDSASPWAVYLLGMGYGLAGAGCTGPILGTILLMSAQSSSPIVGAAMMAAYAAGMFAPVMVVALAWDALDVTGRAWLRPRPIRLLGRDTTIGNVVSGGLCLLLGLILIVTGGSFSSGILDASAQADLESRVMTTLSDVPVLTVACLAIALVAALVLVVMWLRGRDDSASSTVENS
ncbi:cytochrome c biogenesis protein CcdA [Nanchangia anserum]|uniref:Cytochrome c biogenesis protein CcdA n=1 Tax=Nanchangia anserum TaxID=2692125 RepID=A0A8I0GEZ6_9ACTO|nr:cytochrome c biogenesis CcdA family protein [Nanchangia anserum]MBD3689622.1 cytochrome c biogenesis protein CcdA [Nanchangia anserum]QOX81805.1 cytochrome c biogenesis protein CcdA [Nanchangia anserum]